MVNFSEQQINDIIFQYQAGKTIEEISEQYSVCRPTIQKVLKGNYPAYKGKRRALEASESQTKICSKCHRELPLASFNRGNSLFGRRSYCRDCEHILQNSPEKVRKRREKELQRRQNPEYVLQTNRRDLVKIHSDKESLQLSLLRSAKQRAKTKGLEFDIDISDIPLPEKCPLLGIPLNTSFGRATDNSYSIDRIDSSKGYIKGNVWVISKRANTLKGNASLEELSLLVQNLEQKIKEMQRGN